MIAWAMSIHITLLTWWRGRLVGADTEGNRYYEDRVLPKGPLAKHRRWVIYKGLPEASKVPSEWHRWLHYTTDTSPTEDNTEKPWQKPHAPNTTGTVLAYKPKGFPRTGRLTPTLPYEPWDPAC